MSDGLRRWIAGLPKAELHVHLEGTIAPATFARIAQRNGVSLDRDPADYFRCHNFESFLHAFIDVVSALREPEDFAEIAWEYLHASALAGVRHIEFMLSPGTLRYFRPDADLAAIIAGISDACRRAEAEFGISSLLIIDIVRNLGEDEAFADLALAQASRGLGVVGIGLGGDESNFPARSFQRVFERAKHMGLSRTVHAGEAAGPNSIVDAVELLDAQRIGHGVAARGDAKVSELLRRCGVAIDACPTSNLKTGAVAVMADHPAAEFLERGMMVTLNSDDPAFFGATLVEEFEKMALRGLDRAALVRLASNGFTASFAREEQKARWIAELETYVVSNKSTRE